MATLKQKQAIKEITENHTSVSKAMLKAGYDPVTAAKPSNLTNSKGFQEVMEQMGITDEKLSTVLGEGLDATRAVVMGTKSEESFVDVQPDFAIRHKYLETAIKLKGHLKPDGQNGDTYNTFIQQNNLNPNAPEAKELVDSTLEMLMEKTKRKDDDVT